MPEPCQVCPSCTTTCYEEEDDMASLPPEEGEVVEVYIDEDYDDDEALCDAVIDEYYQGHAGYDYNVQRWRDSDGRFTVGDTPCTSCR